MRFLGSKFTQNALPAGALARTPLEELKRSPRTPSRFRGLFAAGEREGREEGREGKGKEEEKGGEGEFASLVLGGRRPCVRLMDS